MERIRGRGRLAIGPHTQGHLLTAADQRELFERLRVGDAEAENDFARLFSGRLRLMIAARIRDRETARDLAQDALVAALAAVKDGQLREPDRLAAFVHGVGRNVANNYLRRQQALPPTAALDPDAITTPSLEQDAQEAERRALADRALDVLGRDEREVLSLTLVDGLKPGAIAGKLGLSPDVIRARKSRALKKVIAEVARLSRSAGNRH